MDQWVLWLHLPLPVVQSVLLLPLDQTTGWALLLPADQVPQEVQAVPTDVVLLPIDKAK